MRVLTSTSPRTHPPSHTHCQIITCKSRIFYAALANCLPGKEITDAEAASGVSDDPRYRVSGGELMCAGSSDFCQGPMGSMAYRLSMRQAGGSNPEIGVDERGILGALVALTVLHVLLAYWFCFLFFALWRSLVTGSAFRADNHVKPWRRPIFMVLCFSEVTLIAAVFFRLVYFALLEGAVDGTDVEANITDAWVAGRGRALPAYHGLAGVADFLTGVAECAFTLCLILLAKGWKVTRRKISAKGE